jgi:hypothetical protein
MAINPELIRECPHDRCTGKVIEVQLGPKLEHKMLDAERLTWQDGGRIKIVTPGLDDALPVAKRLMHAGQAFGTAGLYRLHDETCKAVQKRTRTKATSS